MDMAWIRWNILLSIGLFVTPAFTSTEQSGFRRYYVLQPGPSGTDRVHVSSISSRTGSAGQPRTYNVELTASFGGQVRTRRMGNQANPSVPLRKDTTFAQQQQQQIRHTSHTNVRQSHQIKISGVNVCGGQCCQGWSQSPGSQRCTKPNCQPQCQNGGMCLRPQLCVCKPGSKGQACEQETRAPPSNPSAGNGHTDGHSTGHNVVPQRPIPQQASPLGPAAAPAAPGNMAQMTLNVKQSPHLLRTQPVQTQVRPPLSMTLHQSQSQHFVLKPKYYNVQTQVHGAGQPADRPIPLSVGQNPIHVGNHTGRIRVVFTPSICKMTCSRGKCQNSCEMGNTTTIISENGHATDTLTASNFRVVVCHLPCMNGGKCNARDKCQCPPNFTGKFCQIHAQNGYRRDPVQQHAQATHVHSTHTLPLTFGGGQNQVKYAPKIVNIHVKHPAEASVQIHQVTQLDSNGRTSQGKVSQSGHYTYHTESTQQGQQSHSIHPNQQAFVHHYPVSSKSTLGRCFQETTGSQCGKPLQGLSKQEDCCNSVGTSWGFHNCHKCPKKPSIPLTESRHATDCPQGYKRINESFCQDVNECQLQGVCPNGDCLNSLGSYRCTCKAGYIPDHTFTTCIPDSLALREEKGLCFRLVNPGQQCLHPLPVQLNKQLCCCSVGKAWGPHCDRCPTPGTAAFKEICPGGMGYTVSGTYRPKPVNQPVRNGKPRITQKEPLVPPVPLPTAQRPVEALSITERQLPAVPVVTAAPEQELVILGANNRSVVEPGQPQLSPGVSTIRMEPAYPEVVEKTSPPAPVAILPSSASQNIAPTQLAEVNECLVSPEICGPGICYNTLEGYICVCHNGHQLDEERNTCVDVDECLDPTVCGSGGFCVNNQGSFICQRCESGYKMGRTGRCEDINECLDRSVCPSGTCTNTPGSYACDPCPEGFEGRDGQCVDIDECQDRSMCVHGDCTNFEGYFVCTCHDGYELSPDGRLCTDVDECQDEQMCTRGHCQNTEGSFTCRCEPGFRVSAAGDQCDDVNECQELPRACGDVGQCINNMGSYHCSCPPGYQQVNGNSCQDVDECQDEQMCTRGHCQNTEGSFTCRCEPGFRVSAAGDQCDDVNECQELPRACGDVGQCINNMGSYHCSCPPGYQQVNANSCQDVDECLEDPELCSPHGECVNAEASFFCVCPLGFSTDTNGTACQDVDECTDATRCHSGSCVNTMGSYLCQCERGYRLQPDNDTCLDIDECEMFGRSICGAWRCENTLGSYRCMVDCPPGHSLGPNGICEDVDECSINRTVCGPQGFCENTVGSFRCLCDTGFQEAQDSHGCVDVNECELLSGVCGEALCDNLEGTFMCICPEEHQEYNQMTATCSPAPKASSVERKECYYNLNEENLCENVLTSSVTIEECCCTLGAGWGDNCEVHPCPVQGTDQYDQMCPAGKGSVPTGDSVSKLSPENSFKDADECALFGREICKGGFCLNTVGGYECYCNHGLYSDEIGLQCLDIDECLDESTCVGGECVNLVGSYMCFCSPPMVLDPSGSQCVSPPPIADQWDPASAEDQVCWQKVTETLTCSRPLAEKTTFTECCCMFGEAWGLNCALCPGKDTDISISMCNSHHSGGRRPYGRDALTAPDPDYHEFGQEYGSPAHSPHKLPLYEEEESPDKAFEGLQEEKCGILNGCENGRCVRVQEGYTCECFDGYTLDMSRMACIDVNECSELNKRMSPCKNGICINTEGSYVCVCLPGFVHSQRPNYCVPDGKEEARTDRE